MNYIVRVYILHARFAATLYYEEASIEECRLSRNLAHVGAPVYTPCSRRRANRRLFAPYVSSECIRTGGMSSVWSCREQSGFSIDVASTSSIPMYVLGSLYRGKSRQTPSLCAHVLEQAICIKVPTSEPTFTRLKIVPRQTTRWQLCRPFVMEVGEVAASER